MKTQTQSNLVGQKLQDLLSVQNLKVGLMFLTSVWGLGGFFIGQFYPLCSLSACFKGLFYGSIFSCLNPSNLSELHIWFNEYLYIYLVKSSSNTWNCSLRIPAVFHMVQLQSPLFSFWNFLAWIRKQGKQIPSIEYSNKLGADLLQSKFATCNWKLVIWTAASSYPL